MRPACAGAGSLLLAALSAAAPATAQSAPVDTAAAIRALSDYETACRRDAGRLWGRSLCGSILLVDPATRFAVASERPPGGEFVPHDGIFTGRLPPGIPVANTAMDWAGQPWAFALLPIAGDREGQAALLLHESFHRIQDSLDLSGPDLLNAHLDERDGRYWFRLELRALAAALRARGASARSAVHDALLFRARRHRLYPGADSLERALELQEGLAEYTGVRLAYPDRARREAAAARLLDDFHARETYVRSAGYASGPGLGVLLDRHVPGWRARVGSDGLAAQLARAVGFAVPAGLQQAAERAAVRYGAEALAAAENRRDAERRERLDGYRRLLVDGPVLLLRQERLSRSFNPNNLLLLGDEGTVYPTGTFTAPWGRLEVREGVLVAADFGTVRVPLAGRGWILEPASGWVIRPGARPGDLELVKSGDGR